MAGAAPVVGAANGVTIFARREEVTAVICGEVLNAPPSKVADVLGNEVLVGQGTTRGESWGADQVVIVDETRVAVGEARGFHFLVPDVRWVDVKNEPRPLQQLSA